MNVNIALLAFTIVTWGYSWVLMKVGLKFMKPLTFATWRCAIAGVALVPLLVLRRAPLPRWGKLGDYTVLGLLQTTGMFGLILLGMQFVTAGKTAVLLYTMPIWTSLTAHFYLKERLTGRQVIGIASGSLGIASILGWDTISQQNIHAIFGELLVILAAVSWALANIWMKTRMRGENSFAANCIQTLIGTLGLALLATSFEENLLQVELTGMALFSLLFTGLIASTVNFTIWFYLLRRMGTHTLASSVMLVPVLGMVFDWLALGSKVEPGVAAGGILILYGIYKVSYK
jgi:drug/metabolite transporter (DMT)-like permease